MARLNSSDELWTEVTEGGFILDATAGTPGSTTTDTAATAGDVLVSVVSETNFGVGDLFRVGTGSTMEVCEVETTAAGQINLVSALVLDHVSGSAVVEQAKTDLGDISEDGVTRETSVDRNEFRVATQAGNYAVLISNAGARISWNLVNHSLENVLASLGIDESNITGAGTTIDPFVGHVDPDAFNELLNHSLYFIGALKDGTQYEIRGFNCDFDANQTMTYARGNPALLPMAADVQRFVYITPL